MAYFSSEFIDFLERLARNNSRDWFHAHKRDYERFVKEPFNAFVAEMIDRISLIDPSIALEPKDAIFRIARDIRFSPDKTPYKTHVAAVISRGGRKDARFPGLFFRFDAKGIAIGGGSYQPDKETLLQIRRAIRRDGATLTRALERRAFRELFGELQGRRTSGCQRNSRPRLTAYPSSPTSSFTISSSTMIRTCCCETTWPPSLFGTTGPERRSTSSSSQPSWLDAVGEVAAKRLPID